MTKDKNADYLINCSDDQGTLSDLSEFELEESKDSIFNSFMQQSQKDSIIESM